VDWLREQVTQPRKGESDGEIINSAKCCEKIVDNFSSNSGCLCSKLIGS